MHLTKADSPRVVRPSFRVKAYDSAGQVSAAREDRLANAGDTARNDDAGQAATSTESIVTNVGDTVFYVYTCYLFTPRRSR